MRCLVRYVIQHTALYKRKNNNLIKNQINSKTVFFFFQINRQGQEITRGFSEALKGCRDCRESRWEDVLIRN